MHKYSKEEKEWLNANIPGKHSSEILDGFKNKFGFELTKIQLKNYKSNNKIFSGFKGSEGIAPPNKGKKLPKEIYEKRKKTMFKKGRKPHNHKPIGSKRINKDGYSEIKIKEPNKWELEHRLIWKKHKGKIPKRHLVIFLDGDKSHLDIDNLALIDQKINLTLNKNNLRFESKELTESGVALAKIINKTKELKKNGIKHKCKN